MIAILDTNYIISREIPKEGFQTTYTTPSVDRELKDKQSIDYRQIYSFLITVREPSEKYVKIVKDKIKSSLLFLSATDIDVVALTLEINEELSSQWIDLENVDSLESVRCLTKDNGMRNALSMFGLLNDPLYKEKKFKLRCWTCGTLFECSESINESVADFCSECGHSTVTRVTVIDTEDGEKVMLSKNYIPRPKEMKVKGIDVLSADQKEYQIYLKRRDRIARNQSKLNFYD